MTMKKFYIFLFVCTLFFFLKAEEVQAEAPMELSENKEYTFTLSGGESCEYICKMPYGRALDKINFSVTDVQIESNELKLYDGPGYESYNMYLFFDVNKERLVYDVGNIEAVAYNGLSNNKMASNKGSIFYYKDKNSRQLFIYDNFNEHVPNSYYTFKVNIDPRFKVSFKTSYSTRVLDSIEKENNDTFKKANKLKYDLYLQIGSEKTKLQNYMHSYYGKLKKNDVDFFKFTAPKSGTYGFAVYVAGKDIPKNKYIKTTIYNKNKKQLKTYKSYNYKKSIGKAEEKKKYCVKKLKKGDTVYIKIEPGNTLGLYGLIVHDATVPFGL